MTFFQLPPDFPERIAAMERTSDHYQRLASTASDVQEAFREFAEASRPLQTSADVETLQRAGAAALKVTNALALIAEIASDDKVKRDQFLACQWMRWPPGEVG